jgi:pre-rRNA-processing protein TSR2
VQNEWGGPDSADKRDWFAGAICDLFPSHADLESVEDRLDQIMGDEFEVSLDDHSETLVAERIILIWEETSRGDFSTVDGMLERWRSGGPGKVEGVKVGGDEEESVDEESGDDDEEDEDVEMGDAAPELVVKEKKGPEIDEDGFTKVPARRKR